MCSFLFMYFNVNLFGVTIRSALNILNLKLPVTHPLSEESILTHLRFQGAKVRNYLGYSIY